MVSLELWRSLVRYARAVLRHWLLLAFFVIGLAGDVAFVLGADVKVPRPVWYALMAFGLLAAQFRAFHDIDLVADRRAAIARLNAQLKTGNDLRNRMVVESISLVEMNEMYEHWYERATGVIQANAPEAVEHFRLSITPKFSSSLPQLSEEERAIVDALENRLRLLTEIIQKLR